jgi:hypothetical protein
MPFGANTRRDLIENVLTEMSLIASGQAPAPEDVANVDRQIEPTVARLQALELLGDFDTSNVPDEFFQPVSIFIADALLAQYGIPHGNEADPGSWNARIARTTDEMRIMRAMRPTYGVMVVNYF